MCHAMHVVTCQVPVQLHRALLLRQTCNFTQLHITMTVSVASLMSSVSTFAMAPVLLAGSKTNSTVLPSNMLAPNDDVSFCAQAMTCERLASMRPRKLGGHG